MILPLTLALAVVSPVPAVQPERVFLRAGGGDVPVTCRIARGARER
ncbi:hypothetical protein [Arenimonas caeni]|nr:hypothetical protein [Arenimonas caeni]